MQDGTGVNERALIRKIAWRTLPLILLSYFVAVIDRGNISFAAATMNADLGFSETIYGFGASAFFLGYALFEVPSNLLLARFGARRWLARIMLTWGLISIATAFIRSPVQFYAMRFALGVAEAGFYPGVILYLTSWFPGAHRAWAISRF
jgi:ACS family tartrate transporter-like MFS transporter